MAPRSTFAIVLLILLSFHVRCFAAEQPNIVFIFSDDHATQAISAYGSRINNTPHIDRIAREGGVFFNSYCANSICGPSRACILTGKHSHLNGFLRNGNRFDSTQWTFPPVLQQSGYQTAIVGKWHLSSDPVGFDYWEVLPGQGNYYNPAFLQMDGSRKNYEGYCTDIITDKAIEWIDRRDKSKPFMLMCQHKAPHRNWSPHPRHFDLYPKDVPEPDTLFDNYANRSSLLKENEMSLRDHFHWGHDMKFRGENLFPESFTNHGNGEYARMTPAQKKVWNAKYEPENQAFIKSMRAGGLSQQDIVRWKYQRYIKDYLKCVQAVDDGVGRILDFLDETGLSENTIVIYSSDQGFYLGEHGWYDKRWMFEESLKMPFVIRWPGVVAPGTKSTALIQNIDYSATFLDAAGVEVPQDEVQGRSLVPLLKNDGVPPADWRDAIYYAYYENAAVHAVPIHDGVRSDRYKLMYFPRGRQWQMFDLEVDPQELRSVHNDPNYESIFEGLKQRLVDLRKFYQANWAAIPQTRGDLKWWRDRDREKSAEAKKGQAVIAFIGDSITQGWEGAGRQVWEEYYAPRKPINLGFGGDRTEHVIWRLQPKNLGKFNPRVAVLLIGTNNTGHKMQEPAEVADGVAKILDMLGDKNPDTKILMLGVFPRGEDKFDSMRLNNVAINQRIRRLHDGDRVHYLDIGDVFLEEDGTISPQIMPDKLHLSPQGYSLWAEAMEPKLVELLGE